MNIYVPVFLNQCFISLDIYSGAKLLDHMVILFLVFGGTSMCFP